MICILKVLKYKLFLKLIKNINNCKICFKHNLNKIFLNLENVIVFNLDIQIRF